MAALAAALLLFGILDAAQMRAQWSFTGYPGDLGMALRAAVPPWLVLLVLAPGVWRLSRVVRLDRSPLVRGLAIHGVASVVFAAIHVGLQAVNAITIGGYDQGWRAAVSHLAGFYFVSRMLTYLALAAGAHALLLFHEARDRAVAASRLEAQLQQARLDALRRQLNPHFLFNTLNGLSSLALRGDREAVVDGLSRVGDLLRITLDEKGPDEVPLRDEIELTSRFIELQELRFGDRLTVTRDVPDDAAGALVPSMLLQPLVENALDHGIAKRPGPGTLAIRASRTETTLMIDIEDTGPGFSVTAGNGEAGIGLSNTRERLAQLYGAAASLETGAAAAGGARVTVRLPYRA